jgi:predicted RNA-binding Zn ribbon-like protein
VRFADYTDHSVALAVDLVNSHSPVTDQEHLAGVGDLRAFLADHAVKPAREPGERDLADVRTIRRRLRGVFEAADESAAIRAVNEILDSVQAHPYLSDHDDEEWHLHYAPTEAPVARHLAATAAMGLAVAIAEGGFERLGVCAWDRCRDVFVDASKNRSRRYCDPAVCGNRASAAAFRARRKSQIPPG